MAGLRPGNAAQVIWDFLNLVEKLVGQVPADRDPLLTAKPPVWQNAWRDKPLTMVQQQALDAWARVKDAQEQAFIREMPSLASLKGMTRFKREDEHGDAQRVLKNLRRGECAVCDWVTQQWLWRHCPMPHAMHTRKPPPKHSLPRPATHPHTPPPSPHPSTPPQSSGASPGMPPRAGSSTQCQSPWRQCWRC